MLVIVRHCDAFDFYGSVFSGRHGQTLLLVPTLTQFYYLPVIVRVYVDRAQTVRCAHGYLGDIEFHGCVNNALYYRKCL